MGLEAGRERNLLCLLSNGLRNFFWSTPRFHCSEISIGCWNKSLVLQYRPVDKSLLDLPAISLPSSTRRQMCHIGPTRKSFAKKRGAFGASQQPSRFTLTFQYRNQTNCLLILIAPGFIELMLQKSANVFTSAYHKKAGLKIECDEY